MNCYQLNREEEWILRNEHTLNISLINSAPLEKADGQKTPPKKCQSNFSWRQPKSLRECTAPGIST